jgi:glycosyltransferase involved in cell wall biosynthesis
MLTVLIATRNGRRILPGVLEAYGRVQSPAGGFKLVVVDNGSTDGTSELEARFRDRLPLTWLAELKPGKNAALNRGLSAVEGDLVVFADDDAFPRPDLLVLMRAAADEHPAFSIFGGAVVPRWEVPPPEWLLRWVPPGPVFSLTPPTLEEGPTGPQNVFGPNMAVRSQVFEAGHRFDPAIGPRGTHYPMGSETEFVRRLVRQGHMAWHVAGAVSEHFIREFQMQPSWIRGRAVRFGRGQFRLARTEAAPATATWLGVPRYLVRGLCEQAARMVRAGAGRDGERLFRARWEFNYLWGQVVEARAMRTEVSPAWARR